MTTQMQDERGYERSYRSKNFVMKTWREAEVLDGL